MISCAGAWRQAGLTCAAVIVFLVLLPVQSSAAANVNWFFEKLNPYTGTWKGRGFGRRKNSDDKEAVSCRGVHKWLKKGREFEQRYTCWGGDFAVSGAIRIMPGRQEGSFLGQAMNGAREVTGKIWGQVAESGELKVNMRKNFSKKISQASLVPKKNGSIVYTVMVPQKGSSELREILRITYKKFKKRKRK